MGNNKNFLAQIEAMENFYIHSMENYFLFLSEKYSEIDQDKEYSIDEIKDFFGRHSDLYETWWLDWYWEAIYVLKEYIRQNQIV